ncbi:MAG: hypothetical protein COW00_09325 [Bdellovibrio sp. CG12_big_fil_rev_8_21_14_0_65_39_13]|nr:MAG: hypothetical protein COW78_09400 [Bdellovibrio sp. CG22_combo_CG10-13_8_21_14_all_39_27]PIQ59822.1 MAG: hypothetical protein COW00_09325 [Bdellovibrio sp. CG12_big_fil_rev_8_21_14_0_65_39_13]PIR36150.1 MAG: hypothetical protein COV37_04065 [Bdellovibrio sp. CG11_big_fil_rev_8_21_14_0_20_39_38]PJB53817.1 MAG: hypothetical protein CO099_05040 [Bdellovibrio sp. CG_4_9_14_3_um_filter_39_7]
MSTPELKMNASLLHDGSVVKLELSENLFANQHFFLQQPGDAQGSPYLQGLFALNSVRQILIKENEIRLRLTDSKDWKSVAKLAADLTRQHYAKDGQLIPAQFKQHFSDQLNQTEKEDLMMIEQIIKDQVIPSLAAHGGTCEVENYSAGILTLRFSGGCQGCSQITVTVKDGIERLLKDKVSSLREVRDATDHAQGDNPYFN